jgi:hypothetical protein
MPVPAPVPMTVLVLNLRHRGNQVLLCDRYSVLLLFYEIYAHLAANMVYAVCVTEVCYPFSYQFQKENVEL